MKNRIRERLKELGVLQKELAEKLNMTVVGFNQIALSPMLKIETFEKVANALGVPAWSLMLSDEEIEEIRAVAPEKERPANEFICPQCGAKLKVVPADDEV